MTTTDVATLTKDPFEQEILRAEYATPLEDDCEHDAATRVLLLNLAAVQKKLKARHMDWGRQFLSGKNPSKIAEAAGVTYQAVHVALKTPKMQSFLQMVGQLQRLEAGPSLVQRKGMLWRIAKREEEDDPRTAIAALDLINKQEGIYRPDGELGDGQLIVQVKNFTLNQIVQPNAALKDVQPPAEIIEGEFTPVTVETSDE